MLYPNPQIYHHLRTIFVHVPKTAGTSIERQLRERPTDVVGGHTTALAYRRHYPECFDAYYKFAVVRHPQDRFLSAWRYLRGERVHPALGNQIVHEHTSLDQFLETLRSSPATLVRIVHFQPQHHFICDEAGAVLVDEVFRFEELADGWRRISQRLALDGRSLARLNVSRQEEAAMCDASRLRMAVEEIYARDFELFRFWRQDNTGVQGSSLSAAITYAQRP